MAAGWHTVLIIGVGEVGDLSRYGLSYGAYVRRGSGLYTQLMSYNLLMPALGLANSLQRGQAANSGCLPHRGYRTVARSVWLRGDSLGSDHGTRRPSRRSFTTSRPRRIDPGSRIHSGRMVRRSYAAGVRRSEPMPMGRRVEVRFLGREKHIEHSCVGTLFRRRPIAGNDGGARCLFDAGSVSLEKTDAATSSGPHRGVAGDFLRPYDVGIFHGGAGISPNFSRESFRVGLRVVCGSADGMGACQNSFGRLANRIRGQAARRDRPGRHGINHIR